MTRREEIINNIGYKITRAAFDYTEKHEFADTMDAFEAGAEWMHKKMLEKAVEWLQKYFVEDHYGMSPSGFCVFADMFIKAMEE